MCYVYCIIRCICWGKKYFDCRNVYGMSNKQWNDNIPVLRVHCLFLIVGFNHIMRWRCFNVSLSSTEWMRSRGVRSKKTGLTYMMNSHLQNHYLIHCFMGHKNMYSIVYNSRFSWETYNSITLDTFKINSHGFTF